MNLSVVLPCFNEQENIENTVRDVASWFSQEGKEGEVIVVNDGSTDGTREVLEHLMQQVPVLRVVHHEANKGYGASVTTGCDAAAGEAIVFMDSDGQFKAQDISLLLHLLQEVGFVSGIRKRRADPLNRKLNAWLYGALVRLMLGIRVKDLNCGLKAFTKTVWQQVHPVYATGALLNAEMFLLLKEKGISFAEVEVGHYPRTAGKQTGANLQVIIGMFKELWKLKKAHATKA